MLAARRVLRGGSFDLHVLIPAETAGAVGGARLGLIVPKRLARRAVLRNAIKRQAREAFRSVAATLHSADLVLRLVKPQVGDEKFGTATWRREILDLLGRLPQLMGKN